MEHVSDRAQAAMWIADAAAGYSLEWTLTGDASEALARLQELSLDGALVGLGRPLLEAAGASIPGLRIFEEKLGQAHMPSTQAALWAYVLAPNAGEAFDRAEQLQNALLGMFHLVQVQPLMRYRDGRDLTDYRDGTGNPQGDAAFAAALVSEGDWAGGTFALVQRYLHFRSRFFRLDAHGRDDVIGRRHADDTEMGEDAPIAAHIRRVDQEGFEEPSFVVRRSMPWGDIRRHGLQFVALMKDLSSADRMLSRMVGLADGVKDQLLDFTQAETGAFYFCPPQRDGRLWLEPLLTNLSPPIPDMSHVEVAQSRDVRIRFEARRCIHSRGCVLARPDVFVPNVQGEWIHPEVARADDVAELAHQCPSGAIQYDRLDGGPAEAPPLVNVIRLRENGPYAVHADIRLGANAVMTRATLCRCGASKNKPFCDSSHHDIGFKASGEPEAIETPPLPVRGGPLHIEPMWDGPLVITGPVEIVSGTGRTVAKATHPTLCRCGQSNNKPFCDGSHARVGFRAEGM